MDEKDRWQRLIDQGLFGERIVRFYQEVGSTNTEALALGRNGLPEGSLVLAGTQTGGRGRLGRKWLSPGGCGLYFSMILRPELDPGDLPKITLTAGVAVCQAIEEETGIKPLLKWPNDLMRDGCKFGGILTETDAVSGSGRPLVVLGIGLNISTPGDVFPEELRARVTSLVSPKEDTLDRVKLLTGIVRHVEESIRQLEKGEFPMILREFAARDAIRGRELSWLSANGEVVCGISQGLDQDGLLHIRDLQGRIHEVLSGDVQLKR
ncbi:biotin--[acetyl-CoA-carboxylase] ligase [Thermodesulfobacteriota bacterium]